MALHIRAVFEENWLWRIGIEASYDSIEIKVIDIHIHAIDFFSHIRSVHRCRRQGICWHEGLTLPLNIRTRCGGCQARPNTYAEPLRQQEQDLHRLPRRMTIFLLLREHLEATPKHFLWLGAGGSLRRNTGMNGAAGIGCVGKEVRARLETEVLLVDVYDAVYLCGSCRACVERVTSIR